MAVLFTGALVFGQKGEESESASAESATAESSTAATETETPLRILEETSATLVSLSQELEAESEASAEAESRPRRRAERQDQKFALGSTIRVGEGEVVSDLFAMGGDIKIDGEVDGGAVSVGGPIKVNGVVRGDVIAVGDSVELGPEAQVYGNVTSVGGVVEREEGAEVTGEVSEVSLGEGFSADWSLFDGNVDWGGDAISFDAWVELFWGLVWTSFLVVMCGVILLIVPRSVHNVRETAIQEPWKALIVGISVELLFLPVTLVLSFLLLVSLIGIPFLLLMPFLYLLLFAAMIFGFAGVAVGAGRFLNERFGLGLRNAFICLVVGTVALRMISLSGDFLDAIGIPFLIYGLFVVFGWLVQFVAWTIGLGAVLVSRFGARAPLGSSDSA